MNTVHIQLRRLIRGAERHPAGCPWNQFTHRKPAQADRKTLILVVNPHAGKAIVENAVFMLASWIVTKINSNMTYEIMQNLSDSSHVSVILSAVHVTLLKLSDKRKYRLDVEVFVPVCFWFQDIVFLFFIFPPPSYFGYSCPSQVPLDGFLLAWLTMILPPPASRLCCCLSSVSLNPSKRFALNFNQFRCLLSSIKHRHLSKSFLVGKDCRWGSEPWKDEALFTIFGVCRVCLLFFSV